MKKIKWLLMISFAATLIWSCGDDDLDSNSIFDNETTIVENKFDTWLYDNYVKTYNINFKYRFEDKESDEDYNLIPADFNKSVALAKMIKHVWIEAYDELLGKEFMQTYCPKVMHLVGSPAYNSQGSIVLGTAEGGLKITMYNVNIIDVEDPDIDEMNFWFFKTMHHEFAHILHQTKEYPTDFNLITPSYYQSDSWVNLSQKEALDMGFVSEYASKETQEDFVEIISIYVTNTPQYWDTLVGKANEQGQSFINQKLALVKSYLERTWGIHLDVLRDIVLRRSDEIGDLDLTLN